MSLLVDFEGFIKPVVFLIVSFIIMYISYKKGLKYIWLAFLPIVSMFFYEDYKEDVRIEKKQQAYLTSSWIDVYDPLYVTAIPNEEIDTKNYDEWILKTENGEYNVRFLAGQTNGYEMYDILWEKESLVARKNVLEVIEYLGIEGTPIFNEATHEYTIKGSANEYTITITNKGRVYHVVDKDGRTIYLNEENDLKPEGRPLTEEEVN